MYTAQVNNSKQIDNRLVTIKTSNFFELKKYVKVGINEYAHTKEDNTTKNQERVWFTARLQIKQVINATAYDIVGIQNQAPLITRN